MKRKPVVVLLVLALAASAHAGEAGEDALHAALVRVDAVAARFLDAAIKFDCKESMVFDGGSASFNYIYIRENGKTKDFRSYTGLSAHDPMTPVIPEVPRYLSNAFLWFQIFRQGRWLRHHYQLAGEATVLDRPAFGIRFDPIPPIHAGVNDWYGTAWFDADTAQLLRVVAYTPYAWHQRLLVEEALREAPSLPVYQRTLFYVEEITTEYGLEARGLRLPTSVHIETVEKEVRGTYAKPSRERVYSQTWQRYKKYRFFATDAEEQVAPVQ